MRGWQFALQWLMRCAVGSRRKPCMVTPLGLLNRCRLIARRYHLNVPNHLRRRPFFIKCADCTVDRLLGSLEFKLMIADVFDFTHGVEADVYASDSEYQRGWVIA